MATTAPPLERLLEGGYPQGFVTDVDSDSLAPGLSEAVIRQISAKKQEPDFMLQWRLAAYRHWRTMPLPTWSRVHYAPIYYNAISYYSSPKSRTQEGSIYKAVMSGAIL